MMRWTITVVAAAVLLASERVAPGQNLPEGFLLEEVASGLDEPVAVAFAGDGRIFIAERKGVVRVFLDGEELPSSPFIDLQEEIDKTGLRGLLGLTLDPGFLGNHRVYLAYSVMPPGGLSGDGTYQPTFGRVTRYSGTAASNGNVADPDSRAVLIGEEPGDGVAICWAHIVDALRFGEDGSLLLATGDGAHFSFADAGGNDPECFEPPLFDEDQDIGAFRAQHLGSMNGKVLRIDPETGHGLPDNPHWDGDPESPQSRVWVSGLRNPYRFAVRPGSGSDAAPGALYIGDVGWDDFEEITVSTVGGENFGWPCYEGPHSAPQYPDLDPPHGGCQSIGTPENPGPLTDPLLYWHQHDAAVSGPDPVTGRTVIGGDFSIGDSYPPAYRDAYFFADWWAGWVRVLRVDDAENYVNSFAFADGIEEIVDLVTDPISGDVHLVTRMPGSVYRIRYDGPGAGDLTGDGSVGVDDLLIMLAAWGDCPGPAAGPQECPADITGDGVVNVDDLLILLSHWG